MVRKKLRFAASVVLLLVASAGIAVPARADGDVSFSLHSYVFDLDEAFNHPTEPLLLKWHVTVCTPTPAKVRVRAITRSPSTGDIARARFVRHQPEGCTRQRFRSFKSPDYVEGYNLRSRLRVAWRDQGLRTPWRAENTNFGE